MECLPHSECAKTVAAQILSRPTPAIARHLLYLPELASHAGPRQLRGLFFVRDEWTPMENPENQDKRMFDVFVRFWAHFYNKFIEIICLKAP